MFSEQNILRVYCKFTGITSSSYNPLVGWMQGALILATFFSIFSESFKLIIRMLYFIYTFFQDIVNTYIQLPLFVPKLALCRKEVLEFDIYHNSKHTLGNIIPLNNNNHLNSSSPLRNHYFSRRKKIYISPSPSIMISTIWNWVVIIIMLKIIKCTSLKERSDGDGITIYGAAHIWVDHCSLSNCFDGFIDVVHGSTAVTISNNYMTRHNKVMLFGHSDSYEEDKNMQATIAFNHFGEGLGGRMPRCRFGYFHVVNNDYTHWQQYAIGGSSSRTIFSQGNRFLAPDDDDHRGKRYIEQNKKLKTI
ncbi:putative pectate lyase [Medicago truncatula]|uniref:Pectate lyase n=1 Tax=Medicago truncatula TaxID=3880 RepID=A0A396IRN1_MEDTR|nr:putative pectate lyase [Medicago truncatula]